MIQNIVHFASQNLTAPVLLATAFACLIIVGLIVIISHNRWRELREAVDLVRNTQPEERNYEPYGHRLVWPGPYYQVEFKLGDDKGAIVFQSDGHEKGWRVAGPLWWLRIDKGHPQGFYCRSGDDAPRSIPRSIRATFDTLVQAVRDQTIQYA